MSTSIRQSLSLLAPHDLLPHQIENLTFRSAAELFQRLDELGPDNLRDAMLVLDLGGESTDVWNVGESGSLLGTAAQLVLAYPEVYSVFFCASEYQKSSLSEKLGLTADPWQAVTTHHFVDMHSMFRVLVLASLHAHGFRTTFDATGLRTALKSHLFATAFKGRFQPYDGFCKSRQDKVAAVLDEEASFVYLNGYAAYKAGFRAWLGATFAEYKRLLVDGGDGRQFGGSGPEIYDVALSDWDLTYADLTDVDKAPSLLVSPKHKPREKEVRAWYVITSFPDVARETARNELPNSVVLAKPYPGFFAILAPRDRANADREILPATYADAWEKTKRNGPDSQAQAGPDEAGTPTNHSAPYACGQLATRLLQRARSVLRGTEGSTESWVHAALLAEEAKEILGGLSRTMTYECIALANEAEVNAEASFFGTSANIEAVERLDRLEEEAAIVVGSGHGAKEKSASEGKLNFLIQAVNNLRVRFREYEQFEAAEECLRRLAKYEIEFQRLKLASGSTDLDTTGSISTNPSAGTIMQSLEKTFEIPRRCLTLGGAWYLNKATKGGTSVGRLIWASFLWVVGFWLVYWFWFQFHPGLKNAPAAGLWHALGHSALTFVEFQPGLAEYISLTDASVSGAWKVGYLTLLLWELVVAYLHLGLLVAVLYRRLTKASG